MVPFRVSVGIMAHDEGHNIGRLLDALGQQSGAAFEIAQIVVVSSASADGTDAIVRDRARRDPRIELVVEAHKRGKAAAINLFLARCRGDVVVLQSADTLPLPGTFQALCAPFADPAVGMVGGHPVPTNPRRGVLHHLGHLLWEMHHEVSLIAPKTGELVAFRPVVARIDPTTCCDEDYVRLLIDRRGLRVVYAPDALCVNRAPSTWDEFLRQRYRVDAGEIALVRGAGFHCPTLHTATLARAVLRYLRRHPERVGLVGLAMTIEGAVRLWAWYRVATLDQMPEHNWRSPASTKTLGTVAQDDAGGRPLGLPDYATTR
ncbi:MAG TPA: glycosyltransferase [Thermomicrobiales bacterium]|nr:glycosyltransferase [Thermomicrobiales bacterium]